MIILNGGSSSGKSRMSRCLQDVLPGHWLAFSVDDFVDALPEKLEGAEGGITFTEDGGVHLGPEFRTLEKAWTHGIVAMVRAGARIVVDDVFLGGPASQERWRHATRGLDVLWVGVRCDVEVASARETARGDRTPGMAALQAGIVHRGVTYDLEVDTSHTESLDCARAVAAHVG
ncbi:chloramphenicol phosphotransferase CPT [Streptomyces roseicoloratus]|uniref:chloramphenicol phosphotransferase CPT n=1 Tax=Streptomyces roseicoloratus TaxID=2508722 RepID=UPI001009F56F|nr:chloramphenicol phosphotransferase CPT [Streptomyces roseicoloratus]